MNATSTIAITASLSFLLLSATTATAEYSARDFFAKAPPETFYTEVEMTTADKEAILKSNFRRSPDFSCEAWGVADESPSSLTLKICPDSSVYIQLFRETSGDTLVGVESNRSSGRAFELLFYRVIRHSEAIVKLSDNQLKTLGLEEIGENELLSEQMKFPKEMEQRVLLSLDGSGTPRASIATWGDPRWKERQVTFNIFFQWNGSRFQKILEPNR
ncbi:MAG: hypothetical protein RL518_1552 [Pseudomonadota bacterium]|jgi:hypothetical protein